MIIKLLKLIKILKKNSPPSMKKCWKKRRKPTYTFNSFTICNPLLLPISKPFLQTLCSLLFTKSPKGINPPFHIENHQPNQINHRKSNLSLPLKGKISQNAAEATLIFQPEPCRPMDLRHHSQLHWRTMKLGEDRKCMYFFQFKLQL